MVSVLIALTFHVFPMEKAGIRTLEVLCVHRWNEQLATMFVHSSGRSGAGEVFRLDRMRGVSANMERNGKEP